MPSRPSRLRHRRTSFDEDDDDDDDNGHGDGLASASPSTNLPTLSELQDDADAAAADTSSSLSPSSSPSPSPTSRRRNGMKTSSSNARSLASLAAFNSSSSSSSSSSSPSSKNSPFSSRQERQAVLSRSLARQRAANKANSRSRGGDTDEAGQRLKRLLLLLAITTVMLVGYHFARLYLVSWIKGPKSRSSRDNLGISVAHSDANEDAAGLADHLNLFRSRVEEEGAKARPGKGKSKGEPQKRKPEPIVHTFEEDDSVPGGIRFSRSADHENDDAGNGDEDEDDGKPLRLQDLDDETLQAMFDSLYGDGGPLGPTHRRGSGSSQRGGQDGDGDGEEADMDELLGRDRERARERGEGAYAQVGSGQQQQQRTRQKESLL